MRRPGSPGARRRVHPGCRGRGRRRSGFPRIRTLCRVRVPVAAALAAAYFTLALAACSEPEPYKPTFFGRVEGVREPASKPEGLNPLGAIQTCSDRPVLDPTEERVLVARPDLFTREASLMISSLRQAVSDNYRGQRAVRFLTTQRFVQTEAQAVAEGRRCAALIVLWEIYGTRALELTVPEPARIPLKAQLHPRLCEFGNYAEQLQILYLTITGLLAMGDNDYDTATGNIELAMRIDSHCLRLPEGATALPAAGPRAQPGHDSPPPR